MSSGKMGLVLFLLIVLFGFGCQNFEYSHPLCSPALRVDVQKLVGPHYQFGNTIALFGRPTIEGTTDLSVSPFRIEKNEKGVGQYRMVADGESPKDFQTCKIGDHILVENLDIKISGNSTKRSLFQLDVLPDGFLITAVEIDPKQLKASGIPYQTIADQETLSLDDSGLLKVVAKNLEQVAKEKREKRELVKALLIDTSNPKDALTLGKMLQPDSDSRRIYHGVFTPFSERK